MTILGRKTGHQGLDLLAAGPVGHQNGVAGLHHNKILHAQRRHQTASGMDVASPAVLGQHIPHTGITFRILRAVLIDGFPGSQVAPAARQRHHGHMRAFFHQGIIHRIRGTLGKRFPMQADEVIIGPAQSPGLAHRGHDGRCLALQLRQILGGAEHEHAAVPEIAALRQHGFGSLLRRLFHKTADRETGGQGIALFDVTITGLGAVRCDAKGDQGTFTGTLRGLRDSSRKSRQVFQHMVRRQDQQHRVAVFHIAGSRHGQRCSRDGRSRIARFRFQQDLAAQALPLQGCGGKKTLLFITDDHGRSQFGHGRKTLQRVLEQRMTAQVHELLGIFTTRQGPQACTGAPAQDDGTDLHVVCSVYLEAWRKSIATEKTAGGTFLRPYGDAYR